MDNNLIISGMCSVTVLTVRLFRTKINETVMGSKLRISTDLNGWVKPMVKTEKLDIKTEFKKNKTEFKETGGKEERSRWEKRRKKTEGRKEGRSQTNRVDIHSQKEELE